MDAYTEKVPLSTIWGPVAVADAAVAAVAANAAVVAVAFFCYSAVRTYVHTAVDTSLLSLL